MEIPLSILLLPSNLISRANLTAHPTIVRQQFPSNHPYSDYYIIMQTGSGPMNKIKKGKIIKKKGNKNSTRHQNVQFRAGRFAGSRVKGISSSTGFRCLIVCQIHDTEFLSKGDGRKKGKKKKRKRNNLCRRGKVENPAKKSQ